MEKKPFEGQEKTLSWNENFLISNKKSEIKKHNEILTVFKWKQIRQFLKINFVIYFTIFSNTCIKTI